MVASTAGRGRKAARDCRHLPVANHHQPKGCPAATGSSGRTWAALLMAGSAPTPAFLALTCGGQRRLESSILFNAVQDTGF